MNDKFLKNYLIYQEDFENVMVDIKKGGFLLRPPISYFDGFFRMSYIGSAW